MWNFLTGTWDFCVEMLADLLPLILIIGFIHVVVSGGPNSDDYYYDERTEIGLN